MGAQSDCQPIGTDAMNAKTRLLKTHEAAIAPGTPLRLKVAAEVAFPCGGMTASGLRREAARGRLVIEMIAGKHYTTLESINEMREKCRVNPKVQDCGLNRNANGRQNLSAGRIGSSVTETAKFARAALEKTARTLNARSPTTSPPNTSPQDSATVTPLKL
jgi:hypothetical protein